MSADRVEKPEMVTTQYLVAHKVRGERAFDIAHQMQVGTEIWWIVTTSGHRAYPYWWIELEDLTIRVVGPGHSTERFTAFELAGDMPENLRDHYTAAEARRHPAVPKSSLDDLNIEELLK